MNTIDFILFASEFFEKKASQLLKLAKKKTPEPEAPEDAPFGQYAWCERRWDFPNDLEKDNELEDKIFKEIRKHFSSSRVGLSKDAVKLLINCMENGWYKPVLHAPPYDTLYRGLKLKTKKEVAKLLDLSEDEIEDSGKINFNDDFTIPPINGNSTSWSFKKIITKDFSTNYGKSKTGYAITIIADVKDNKNRFLAGPNGLYDVNGMSRWHLEKETVGLEPIIIKRVEWIKL